ncbi:hypothetical protein [Chryseobacterium luteum]|uniref:Uncharacterized protein n=1 Tax=Chryseobacterium luteum TaxID=421531 RepID=A0A085ZBN1_9FLAO|nr:hypothetical protein [Chryseobacterium luteum]KFF01845.1 hypothetical protein IX38_15220 [Chryseobacterium luteum]
MILKFEKDTDGVLLLCSKKGLEKYYRERDFNYDFPEGIIPLINQGIVAAIVTESGEDVVGEIRIMEGMNNKENYNISSENKFFIELEDELFLLSHSEFTQICYTKKGDIDNFEFWDEKVSISNLRNGWAFLLIHTKASDEVPYLDIIFQLTFSNIEPPYEDTDVIIAV